MLGLVAWAAAAGLGPGVRFAEVGAATVLAGQVGLAIWLYTRHGWRWFGVGLLLGGTLTCLLPVGYVLIVGGRSG